MSKQVPVVLHTVVEYLNHGINQSEKSQLQIAKECGFQYSNVITALKQGKMKVPVDRVKALANSLSIDTHVLLLAVLSEDHPDLLRTIEDVFDISLSSLCKSRSDFNQKAMSAGEEAIQTGQAIPSEADLQSFQFLSNLNPVTAHVLLGSH